MGLHVPAEDLAGEADLLRRLARGVQEGALTA